MGLFTARHNKGGKPMTAKDSSREQASVNCDIQRIVHLVNAGGDRLPQPACILQIFQQRQVLKQRCLLQKIQAIIALTAKALLLRIP